MTARLGAWIPLTALALLPMAASGQGGPAEDAARRLAPFFRPPPSLANDFGPYRSPLRFDEGRPVRDAADWARRRDEILRHWHSVMGPWPPLLDRPAPL